MSAEDASAGFAPVSDVELGQMNGILSSILSPFTSDADRQAATVAVETGFEDEAERVVLTMLALLRPVVPIAGVNTEISPSVRNLILVLFYQNIARGEVDLYSRLSLPARTAFKTELLQFLLTEQTPFLVTACQNAVVRCAEVTLYRDEWPELFPFIFSCASASSTGAPNAALLLRVALYFIEALCDKCVDSLLLHIDPVLSLLSAALSTSPDLAAAVAAVRASCALASCDLPAEVSRALKPFVPLFLSVLSNALTAGDSRAARYVLTLQMECIQSELVVEMRYCTIFLRYCFLMFIFAHIFASHPETAILSHILCCCSLSTGRFSRF